MADDQEKTEVFHLLNEKGTSPFSYANRYGTKEKSSLDFYMSFWEILNG